MGLDMGTKTIGVALSDERGVSAQPLKTLKRAGAAKDLEELRGLIHEYSVERIVVGMPVNMDGSIGPRARAVLGFIERLKKHVCLPVSVWDERLSTIAVTRVLIDADLSRSKRKKVVDKLAAAYILQGYLDSPRLGAPPPPGRPR